MTKSDQDLHYEITEGWRSLQVTKGHYWLIAPRSDLIISNILRSVSAVLACVNYLAISIYHYSETASAKGVYSLGHSLVSFLQDSPESVDIKTP